MKTAKVLRFMLLLAILSVDPIFGYVCSYNYPVAII